MTATVLTTAPITTVLPVIDLERACRFYEQTLGLKPIGPKPGGQFVFAGGHDTLIALYPKEGGTKAEHTALSFEVDDIEKAIESLEREGVAFEDYDLPQLKTVNHVCDMGNEKAAWFKDPEGNYLCLHQELGRPA